MINNYKNFFYKGYIEKKSVVLRVKIIKNLKTLK